MEHAFPAIQDDDPFGGFAEVTSNLYPGDPFAATIVEKDPFLSSSIRSKKTVNKINNPFLGHNESTSDDDTLSPRAASGGVSPVKGLQSPQSIEIPWPGNNTIDTSEEISKDSAEVDCSPDVQAIDLYSCTQFESSESFSDREIPNIALDSDSGNITVDVNESVPIPNAVYGFIDVGKPNLQIPKVIFTEATLISEKSSSFEVSHGNSDVYEGQTRLLESTESSENLSQHNVMPLPNNEVDDFRQVNNLSRMNISGISSLDESKISDCVDMPGQLDVETTHNDRNGLNRTHVTNRVFTSSPICFRTDSLAAYNSPPSLARWKSEFNERITLQEEQEKKCIEILRENAKSELEKWYKDRRAKIEERHNFHLENQGQFQLEKIDERSVWARMASLVIELQKSQKIDEKRKDTSKLRCLLQVLAHADPVRKGAA